MIMNTLMLIKHIETKTVVARYFKSENDAIQTWVRIPISNEWKIFYLEERKPSGHRYKLSYVRDDEKNFLYHKYIICFSKKEALYLRNTIERINQHYIIQIKKLY